MVKKKSWLGILVMVLVFGMAVAGNIEAQSDIRLMGTWVGTLKGLKYEITFRNGNYERLIAEARERGTYTINNGIIILNMTHIFGGAIMMQQIFPESRWYTANEINIIYRNHGIPDDVLKQMFNETFNYSLDANTLTLRKNEQRIMVDGENDIIPGYTIILIKT